MSRFHLCIGKNDYVSSFKINTENKTLYVTQARKGMKVYNLNGEYKTEIKRSVQWCGTQKNKLFVSAVRQEPYMDELSIFELNILNGKKNKIGRLAWM